MVRPVRYLLSKWKVVDNRNGTVLGYIEARGMQAAMRKARLVDRLVHPSYVGVVLVEMVGRDEEGEFYE